MEPQKYEPHKVGPQKCEPYEVEAKRKKTWDQEMADLFTAFGPISGEKPLLTFLFVTLEKDPNCIYPYLANVKISSCCLKFHNQYLKHITINERLKFNIYI